MKRKRVDSNSDLTTSTATTSSSSALESTLADEAAVSAAVAVAATGTSPSNNVAAVDSEGSKVMVPLKKYFKYNGNSSKYRDWKVIDKLPAELNQVLGNRAAVVITSRQDFLVPGNQYRQPRIFFSDGLNGNLTWRSEFREILLQQNVDLCANGVYKNSLLYRPIINKKNVKETEGIPTNMSFNRTTVRLDYRRVTEQIEFVYSILERYFSNSSVTKAASYHQLEMINLNSPAGCGKTFILYLLSKFRINITYISLMTILSHKVRREYELDAVVLCKFMMGMFSLKYFEFIVLQDRMTHINHRDIDALDYRIFCEKKPIARVMLRLMRRNRHRFPAFFAKERKLLYFLDEYSQLATSMISLIMKKLQAKVAEENIQVILIVAGDKCQINPLFIHPENNYETFFNQNASGIYQFHNQQRVQDVEYYSILDRLRDEIINLNKDPELISFMRNKLKTQTQINIDYQYPIASILEFGEPPSILSHERLDESITDLDFRPWIEWLNEDRDTKLQLIKNIVPFIIFAFTNTMISYHNTSIGVSVYRQLERYGADAVGGNIDDYVGFQMLYFIYKITQEGEAKPKTVYVKNFPFDDVITSDRSSGVPVLTLVKFFPYKILVYTYRTLPRLSVVILLEWNAQYCVVWEPTREEIYIIHNQPFSINQYPNQELYGFPLQMCVGETFQSAQGLTLKQEIYANFYGATLNEIYVILSRVTSFQQCKGLIL